jgi:YfiH family protein
MPYHQPDELRYYTFDALDNCHVVNGVFTRRGGVSGGHWQSLNLGGTVGDDAQHVMENRRRAFRALGRDLESLYDVWQVHSATVVCTDRPRPLSTPHLQADAILTDRPEVTLFMRFADCVPVLLYEPRRRVVGLVHAGWQGTVKRTAAAAVQVMEERYGCQAQDILAAIGPSIGAHHYQVGPDVSTIVQQVFGQDSAGLLIPCGDCAPDRVQLDLWRANLLVLQQAGVRQVEVAGICTACSTEDWYSHRAEQGRTGRFGALIALNGSA